MDLPSNHQTVMPYLILKNASAFIYFVEHVFNSKLLHKSYRDENQSALGHCELQIGQSTIMVADASDDFQSQTANLFIYVDNADKRFNLALKHGATTLMELSDQEYGGTCGVTDPFGNVWWIVSYPNEMTATELEKLKYPIGKFVFSENVDSAQIQAWITDVEKLPQSIETIVKVLSVEELNLPYRPNGWKIKQVIHHLSDSHMNAFIRFKLALTEDSPIIKPYEEDKWATLIDGTSNEIKDSLGLLKHLHAKWSKLLRTMTEENFKRSYLHPEHGKRFQLDEALGMYAWHGNHHLEHIRQALIFKNSF